MLEEENSARNLSARMKRLEWYPDGCSNSPGTGLLLKEAQQVCRFRFVHQPFEISGYDGESFGRVLNLLFGVSPGNKQTDPCRRPGDSRGGDQKPEFRAPPLSLFPGISAHHLIDFGHDRLESDRGFSGAGRQSHFL